MVVEEKGRSWGKALLSPIKPKDKRTFLDEIPSKGGKKTNRKEKIVGF